MIITCVFSEHKVQFPIVGKNGKLFIYLFTYYE